MNTRLLGAAVAAMVGCVGATAVLADTVVLSDPRLGGIFIGTNVTQPATGPGPHTVSRVGPFTSVSGATLDLTEPNPSVSASAQVQSFGPFVSLAAFAELEYYIEITGPTPDVLVDVSGRTILSGGDASLRVAGQGIIAAINGAGSSFDITISLPTGSAIDVLLDAAAAAQLGGPGSGSASAYLDPYFSIDPSNPNADQYSILVSPGIGNSPASGVPELSTWAMLLLGFAGLGYAGYRKTKNERTAFA